MFKSFTLKIGWFVSLLRCKSSFNILDRTNLLETNYIFSHSVACLFVSFISCDAINIIVSDYLTKKRKKMWLDDEIVAEYELVDSLLERSPDLGI